MEPEELFATVFVIGMFLGVFIVYLGLRQRSELLQMRHRERMAMIERGHVPLNEAASLDGRHRGAAVPASRSLSLGIIVVGIGLALMTIIAIAGESPEIGVGVGGAIAIVGGSFIVRSMIARSHSEPEPPVVREPGE